jgi:hypothetical protein
MSRKWAWGLVIAVATTAVWCAPRGCAGPIEHASVTRSAAPTEPTEAQSVSQEVVPATLGPVQIGREASAPRLSVKVVGPDGQPLAGAKVFLGDESVRAWDVSTSPLATTPSSGVVELPREEAAGRLVIASLAGYSLGHARVGAEELRPLEIVLRDEARLTIRCQGPRGWPLPGVALTVARAALPVTAPTPNFEALPLAADQRGLAVAKSAKDGVAQFRGLCPESYWIECHGQDLAEIKGPGGRLTLKPGDNEVTMVLAPMVAAVAPADVLTIATKLPVGLDLSKPSSIQTAIQVAQWRLSQRFPGQRNFVGVAVDPDAASLPVVATGWTDQGHRYEEIVALMPVSSVVPFAVRNVEGSGPGVCSAKIDLVSADGGVLAGVLMHLETTIGDRNLYLTARSGEVARVPRARYAVSILGWGACGAVDLDKEATQTTVTLGASARTASVFLELPDGSPTLFAVESRANSVSTFYGGRRDMLLALGEHQLMFQVPGFPPFEIPLKVDGTAAPVVVRHRLQW